MKLTGILIAIFCSLVLFTACKKSENNDNNKSATALMLEAGMWQQSAYTATVNYMGKDSIIDLYSQIEEFDKDDFILFFGNGKVTIDEATNKCANDNQVETALWTLLNNDTKLAIADNNPDTMDLELTSIQMKLKLTKPNSSGTPVTYVSTYKNIR